MNLQTETTFVRIHGVDRRIAREKRNNTRFSTNAPEYRIGTAEWRRNNQRQAAKLGRVIPQEEAPARVRAAFPRAQEFRKKQLVFRDGSYLWSYEPVGQWVPDGCVTSAIWLGI